MWEGTRRFLQGCQESPCLVAKQARLLSALGQQLQEMQGTKTTRLAYGEA